MKLKEEILGKKRKNYLSWDEYFMGIAKLTSGRSKDPHTQVGACIVGEDNRILSIGYNGAPNNFNDDDFPWNRKSESVNETKYPYVCHAEFNAILNFPGNRKDLKNSKIYVDLFPCQECAKAIIQSGIKEVIYLSDKYATSSSTQASKYMFDKTGITYRAFPEESMKEIKVSLKPDTSISYLNDEKK